MKKIFAKLMMTFEGQENQIGNYGKYEILENSAQLMKIFSNYYKNWGKLYEE